MPSAGAADCRSEGSASGDLHSLEKNQYPTFPGSQSKAFARVAIFLAAGLAFLLARLLEETVPDWRPALWLASTLYAAALLVWCWLSGGSAWLRHFFFPVAFLLLAVPWPYNLEQPLLQGLMRLNATLVADSLLLADIPARAAGNTLLLSTGQLGIEQACSGIRSLQSVLMMSLFLGEFYFFPFRRRLLFCFLGVLLALAGNYFRLLYLAWRAAHDGLPSVAALHDSAAILIMVATILSLWLICLMLPNPAAFLVHLTSPSCPANPPFSSSRPAARWAAGLLLVALLSETFTQGWFRWREGSAPTPPAWTVTIPSSAQPIPISPSTHDLLLDTEARTGTWTDSHGWRWDLLWFRYGPQAANRIAFDIHNPEVCLAAAGLHETSDYGITLWSCDGLSLPVHAYVFTSGSTTAYVFWIARLDRELTPESNLTYIRTPSALFGRFLSWSHDAWLGVRGSGARSLEITITGPTNCGSARPAFLDFLSSSLVAKPPQSATPR